MYNMKQGTSIFKAGKLIKIELHYDTVIHAIKIHGDFFLYPEEGIEKLQQQLIGTELIREKLVDRINQIISNERLEPFGFTSEQLTEAILAAVSV